MKPNLSTYRQVFTLFRPYPRLVIVLIITSFLSVLAEGLGLGLILPLLASDPAVIGAGFLSDIPFLGDLSLWLGDLSLIERVRLAAVALLLVMFMRSLASAATQLAGARLQLNVERDLERQVYTQLHEVQLSFIHAQKMGELITFLSYHVRQSGRLIQSVTSGMGNLFTLIIYSLLVLLISVPLTVVASLFLLLLWLIGKWGFSARIKTAGQAETQFKRQLRSMSVERLTGLKLIHLFAQEAWSLIRLDEILDKYQIAAYRSRQLVSFVRHFLLLLGVLGLSGLLIASTLFFPNQLEAWLTRIVLFLVIAFRLLNPLATLNMMNSQVINLAPTLSGVLEFLRRDDKPYLKNGVLPAGKLQKGILFSNVSFRYLASEAPVLKNVSFEIPKGKMTAVVGPSGAGKSSLVNLIARLYDCESGQICVDGVDLRELDITSWRKQIAVVSQDSFIFNDTVHNNLRFGRPDATHEEVIQAAELAQAHDFIMALPLKYDTLLGDRGVRLSGGQQQRIAIARAIVANPQLLIFDEATSDLDSETEQALQQAISHYGRGRTMLVIAHRLSTIREADNIVVLEAGRVVEQGTHEQLMAHGGLYRRLVEVQELK